MSVRWEDIFLLPQAALTGGRRVPKTVLAKPIRQVIETLWRFDDPDARSLNAYIETDRCKDLEQCEYIYTLCQDQSHGASLFDRQQPVDAESVRRARRVLLEHVNTYYTGQLRASGIDLTTLKDL